MTTQAACNICGQSSFGPGPGGRMSYDRRTPPRCESCQSLERHRAFRAVFDALRTDDFARMSVLQFSKDRSNDPAWFARHEVSVYAGSNSLDLQRIDRADSSYDLIVCNHVIEHVADDRAALRELARVVRPDGFVFLSTPDPIRRPATTDWGFPDEKQHGHYRLYGRDIETKLGGELPGLGILSVTGVDPATRGTEALFLVTASARRFESLGARLQGPAAVPMFEHHTVSSPASVCSHAATSSAR